MLRPKLGRLWGNSNAVVRRDPGDEKYLVGWLSEIPTYQVLNFLQWKTDATIQALAERGVLEWGSDVTYKNGAAVWNEADGKIYVATLDGPTDQPSASSTQWVGSAIQLTRNEYDKTVSAINQHIDDVTSNPHKLTPGRLGTYTAAQIDALVAAYRAEVLAHVQDTNNPHKLTAAIVGAVPVTGGTYTGAVTMQTGQLLLSSDGSQLVKADTTGVYLKNSAGSVGVDANGKGFVKTGSAAATEIVTQQTFADFKLNVEPNYATPSPIFLMPLIRDINIYIGGGTTSTSFTPSYDAAGRLTLPQQAGVGNNLQLSDYLLTGKSEVTMAVDLVFGTLSSGDVIAYSIGLGGGTGSGSIRFSFSSAGKVRAAGDGNSIATAVISDGKPHRAVIRRSATKIALFLDGVLVNEITVTSAALVSFANLIETSGTATAAQMIPVNIANFRVWDSLLSDNQISAL